VSGSAPHPPIGLHLARTARAVTQAFERAMAEAGGSGSTFQVLLLARSREWGAQARLAGAMGITGATLTHHLNALEAQKLIRRWRDRRNRRVAHVALTEDGERLFLRLQRVAVDHDNRLRSLLGERDAAVLASLLARIEAGLSTAALE
jgi:MarR family transcriptional regulator for hemolysin